MPRGIYKRKKKQKVQTTQGPALVVSLEKINEDELLRDFFEARERYWRMCEKLIVAGIIVNN